MPTSARTCSKGVQGQHSPRPRVYYAAIDRGGHCPDGELGARCLRGECPTFCNKVVAVVKCVSYNTIRRHLCQKKSPPYRKCVTDLFPEHDKRSDSVPIYELG